MGYKKDAIVGVSWISGFRMFTRVLAFIKIAALARVLTPSQFGVFGIASLVLPFLEVITETGINVVLIQSSKGISRYLNSAWVVSIIRGVIISLLLICLSPLIAGFFRTPEVLGLLLFMSIVPFVRGFINPAEVIFQKELRFNSEFWFRSVIFLVDAVVSIVLALITHSIYSLVWGLLAGAVLEVVLSFALIRSWPRFVLQKGYIKTIFHKGKWVTIYGILSYFAQQADNIVVGRVMGASSLGIYQMAYKVSILPISEISDVVSRVVFPVYTKIALDRARLSKAFFKTILWVSLASFLMGLVIFLFPHQIILLLLGDKWVMGAPVLQVLALYGVFRTISGPASALFLSVEKQNYVTWMTLLRLCTLLAVILPLISYFGLIGAAYAALTSAIIEIPIIIFFIHKVLWKK